MLNRKHFSARMRRFLSITLQLIIPNWRHIKAKLQLIFSTYKLFAPDSNTTKERRIIRLHIKGGSDAPGLADRIKAYVSTYIIAKESGYNFYIYHDYGFKLDDYLEPNEVDWRIKKNDINFGIRHFKILWSVSHIQPLNQKILEYHTHFHQDVISNLPNELKDEYSMHRVFNKLFKPTHYLSDLLEKNLHSLRLKDNTYIAVHCRFLDFFEAVEHKSDEYPFMKHASKEEQKLMMVSIHKTLDMIHSRNMEMPILLFSDSSKFLNSDHQDFVRTVKGKVGHIFTHSGDKDVIDKAFIDMLLISKANKVYNIIGPGTLASGYSRQAALIGNKPFERIERIMPN